MKNLLFLGVLLVLLASVVTAKEFNVNEAERLRLRYTLAFSF